MVSSKFRADNGVRLLKMLFFEQTGAEKSTVVYTLKDNDYMGYPSLYRLYMEMDDPTEWRFAREYLDGWEHWKMLCECSWFAPIVARWREEMELKLKGLALINIQAIAEGDSKSSFAANRLLLEGGWKEKTQSTRGKGRPKNVSDPGVTKVKEMADRLRLRDDSRILDS